MGWKKGDLVSEAYSELALAGFEFDISPDEIQAGVRKLDTMMAGWGTRGILVGYSLSQEPGDADPDEDSGIPLDAVEATYLNLAMRIAASKGKAVAATTSQAAKAAFDALVSRLASDQVQQQQYPNGTPRGAGRRPWRTSSLPFMSNANTDPLQNSSDGGLTFTGKTN